MHSSETNFHKTQDIQYLLRAYKHQIEFKQVRRTVITRGGSMLVNLSVLIKTTAKAVRDVCSQPRASGNTAVHFLRLRLPCDGQPSDLTTVPTSPPTLPYAALQSPTQSGYTDFSFSLPNLFTLLKSRGFPAALLQVNILTYNPHLPGLPRGHAPLA